MCIHVSVTVSEFREIAGRVRASAPHVWKEAELVNTHWPARGKGVSFGQAALSFARSCRNYSEA